MAASSLGEARPDDMLGLGLARRFLVFLLVAVRGGMGSTGSIAGAGKRVDRSRVRLVHGSSVARPRAVVGGGGQHGVGAGVAPSVDTAGRGELSPQPPSVPHAPVAYRSR
jgi:hypothetical protein